jgi:GNAT superfamily N-acetyltransferase
MVMHIRQMLHEDLDFALSLTSAEGWSSTRRDFAELQEHDPLSCFIGEINAEPIGMVCTASYGEFGFIGNLIVHESCRGQECGRILMEHAMHHLRVLHARSILIDAVPRAETLYERLGFRRICRSLRLEGMMSGERTEKVRGMIQDDLPQVAALDASLFEGRREHFLRMRYAAYPEYAKVLESDGKIQGYIMGSASDRAVRIGPWVIKSHHECAEQLLFSFAQAAQKRVLKVGVLEKNKEALGLLYGQGFEEVSFSWRMVWGEDTEATTSETLYAIYSPDRG